MSAPTIAVVLAGGGVVGHAWHVGALQAVLERTGFDARDADLVLGTSAGSLIGALLRTDLGPADLYARATGGTMSPHGAEAIGRLDDGPVNWPFRPDAPTTRPSPLPAAPALLARLAVPPWRPPGVALAALMPTGRVPATALLADHLRPLLGDRWPERALWLAAVSLHSGHRVVFGRDVLDAALPDAVAASCAIPGLFEPVELGGDRLVDGGAWSTSNADLVARLGFDLVIVSSPMSSTGSPPLAVDWPARMASTRTLRREVEGLRRSGSTVLVLQPNAADRRVMGHSPLDRSRVEPVARQAFESMMTRLDKADVVVAREILLARQPS